jgi:hypothetical protein
MKFNGKGVAVTPVTVTLPNGEIATGYQTEGKNTKTYMLGGDRLKNGTVHAPDGNAYKLTDGKSEALQKVNTIAGGETKTGYMDGGKAYVHGTGEALKTGDVYFHNGNVYSMVKGKDTGTLIIPTTASVQKSGSDVWQDAYFINNRTYTKDGNVLDIGDKSKLANGDIWLMTKNGGVR